MLNLSQTVKTFTYSTCRTHVSEHVCRAKANLKSYFFKFLDSIGKLDMPSECHWIFSVDFFLLNCSICWHRLYLASLVEIERLRSSLMQLSNTQSKERYRQGGKDFFFWRSDSAKQKDRQTDKTIPTLLQSAGKRKPSINIKVVSGIIVLMHL